MRCVRCHRLLTAPGAVSVPTARGMAAVGPVCAKRMGLVKDAARRGAVVVSRGAEVDERQGELFEDEATV